MLHYEIFFWSPLVVDFCGQGLNSFLFYLHLHLHDSNFLPFKCVLLRLASGLRWLWGLIFSSANENAAANQVLVGEGKRGKQRGQDPSWELRLQLMNAKLSTIEPVRRLTVNCRLPESRIYRNCSTAHRTDEPPGNRSLTLS